MQIDIVLSNIASTCNAFFSPKAIFDIRVNERLTN